MSVYYTDEGGTEERRDGRFSRVRGRQKKSQSIGRAVASQKGGGQVRVAKFSREGEAETSGRIGEP